MKQRLMGRGNATTDGIAHAEGHAPFDRVLYVMNSLVMDSPQQRAHVRRDQAFLETIERRLPSRSVHGGHLVLLWHHDPSRMCAYETMDTSESGARVRTTCPLLEGMTGVAVCLNPGEVSIDRTVMVVWSRGIRDAEGRLTHHETGLRFF